MRRIPMILRTAMAVATLAFAFQLPGGGASAEPPALVAYHADGPGLSANFDLIGFRWEQASISVYHNFEGGPCLLAGGGLTDDFGGPASPHVTAAEMETRLSQVIAHLNTALGGRLRLVDAGQATRAQLCAHDSARPIVVGFGAMAAPGLGEAISLSRRDPQGQFDDPLSSRIFISTTDTFTCAETGSDSQLDAVLLHELLHGIGIDHTSVATAVMYFESDDCAPVTAMQPDDLRALDALYGEVTAPPPGTPSPTPAPASPTPQPGSPTPVPTSPPPPAPDPVAVTPNGGSYLAGVNGAVITGGGDGSTVAVLISAVSGRPVQAIWVLLSGTWRYYLPTSPAVDGGLAHFPDVVSATIVLG